MSYEIDILHRRPWRFWRSWRCQYIRLDADAARRLLWKLATKTMLSNSRVRWRIRNGDTNKVMVTVDNAGRTKGEWA